MASRLEELDAQIYAIYQKAYATNRYIRLNPDLGLLGELWEEFDSLVGQDAVVE